MLADLRAQMEERETAGLPELERERKRASRPRSARPRPRSAPRGRERRRSARSVSGWVAAAAKDFVDPDDAARSSTSTTSRTPRTPSAPSSASRSQAAPPQGEEPRFPAGAGERPQPTATKKKEGGIDLDAEAQMVSDELRVPQEPPHASPAQ
jgi:hypothetical protein